MSPGLPLVGWPLLAAVAAALAPSRIRPWLVVTGAVGQAVLAGFALATGPFTAWGGWIALDALGAVMLVVVTGLFLVCALYVPGYLRAWPGKDSRLFCAALLVVLAAQTLAILAHHLGLMWVAIETATLATAPLVYFYRDHRSLEATWKYLMIGGVGIALALFGSFFLAYAALAGGADSSLVFERLVEDAPLLSKPWLHAAFALLFVGYGTKMGLAPMHNWKPDAYGEAPGIVGSVLAGGLTSCAFLAILRIFQICSAAGEADFARQLMLVAGLLSMFVAAVFLARQRDFKRMLAYSSVEHMGILVLGVGIGGAAVFGSLLHVLNNALAKAVLFLSAGNIHRAHGSKRIDGVRGALSTVPLSAGLFLAGFVAIAGSPPFGPFVSVFTIVSAAFRGGSPGIGAAMLVLLLVVFCGMGWTVLQLVQGKPTPPAGGDEAGSESAAAGGEPSAPGRPAQSERDSFATVAPIALAMGAVLLLGFYVPPPLEALLRDAAHLLGELP